MCGESGSELQSPAMAWRGEYRTSSHIMALSSHSGSTHADSLSQSCSHQQWPGEVNTGHPVTLWHEALTQAVHMLSPGQTELFYQQWPGEVNTECQVTFFPPFILQDLNCIFCSVAYPGHPNKLTELHLWRFKLEILLSWLPCGHPNKTRHSDEGISNFGFFYILLFLSEKKNLLDIQEQCIHKLGKIQSELKLLFGVNY